MLLGWSHHRPAERTELVEIEHGGGGVKLAYYLMTEDLFRSLQDFIQSDRTVVDMVWETNEKREIAAGWTRLHRADDGA